MTEEIQAIVEILSKLTDGAFWGFLVYMGYMFMKLIIGWGSIVLILYFFGQRAVEFVRMARGVPGEYEVGSYITLRDGTGKVYIGRMQALDLESAIATYVGKAGSKYTALDKLVKHIETVDPNG